MKKKYSRISFENYSINVIEDIDTINGKINHSKNILISLTTYESNKRISINYQKIIYIEEITVTPIKNDDLPF